MIYYFYILYIYSPFEYLIRLKHRYIRLKVNSLYVYNEFNVSKLLI